jgi:Family of unknown function (DUF6526)
MADPVQTYQTHPRLLRPFHFFVVPVLLANVIIAGVGAVRGPTFDTIWAAVVAFALLMLAFLARTMALTVQDRVIRLEMRLRLKEVLPADLQARAAALSPKQLVALRFASDAELPPLVRDVLDGKLASQKAIKLQICEWQGDHLRA